MKISSNSYIWRTRDGSFIAVNKMETSHVINLYGFLDRRKTMYHSSFKTANLKIKEWLEILLDEIKFRKDNNLL